MSTDDNRQADREDFAEQKVEMACARKHKVSWEQVIYLFLTFTFLGIAIYVIESYH